MIGGGNFSFTLWSWAIASISLSLSAFALFNGSYVFFSSSFSVVFDVVGLFVLLGLRHPSMSSLRLLSVISTWASFSFNVDCGMSFVVFVLIKLEFCRSTRLFWRRLTVLGRNLFVVIVLTRTISLHEFTFVLIALGFTAVSPYFCQPLRSLCCSGSYTSFRLSGWDKTGALSPTAMRLPSYLPAPKCFFNVDSQGSLKSTFLGNSYPLGEQYLHPIH
jgi:hypothetical protein